MGLANSVTGVYANNFRNICPLSWCKIERYMLIPKVDQGGHFWVSVLLVQSLPRYPHIYYLGCLCLALTVHRPDVILNAAATN